MKMKTITTAILAILLSGCSTIQSVRSVEISIRCEDMLGKVGNTCEIKVPPASHVDIDGENVRIKYRPQ
jgi:hypothetical protein